MGTVQLYIQHNSITKNNRSTRTGKQERKGNKGANREKAKIPDKENQQERAVDTLRNMVRGKETNREKAKIPAHSLLRVVRRNHIGVPRFLEFAGPHATR